MTLHTDIFTGDEAVKYLRLDAVSDSPEAALRLLHRLTTDGRIHALKWAKAHLWAKPDLDRFVATEMESLKRAATTSYDSQVKCC